MRASLRFLTAASALLAVGMASAQTRTYLNIGDNAPALKPLKWLKGGAIPGFKKGEIYVVEFWATWCGPCKENIPHLTELARKYQGKASITGVSIWESQDRTDSAYVKKVEEFVKGQGPKMDYHVAVDDPKQTIADAWMKAADEGGIPCSFIVGRDGKIAWIGHPAKMEGVLEQVIANKFDVKQAAASRALEVSTERPIREAMASENYAKVLTLIQAAVAKDSKIAPRYEYERLVSLFHVDPEKGSARAREILTEAEGNIGAYRMISSIGASDKGLTPAAYQKLKAFTDEALEKNEMTYMFLAMAAEIRSSLGEKAEAVKFQERSIKEAEGDIHCPKEFVDFLKKNLERMKSAL